MEKVTVEVAKEHMATLGSVIESYNMYVAGKVGNCHLDSEDYDQLDEDEMETIDIMWALGSALRRARKLNKKTGRSFNLNNNIKLGFDKTKVKCYNCG